MASRFRRFLWIPIVLVLVVLIGVIAQPWIFANIRQSSTSVCSSVQRLAAPSHPMRTVSLGLDVTGSYSLAYAEAAKNAVALAIDTAVQPNQQGLTVYVTLINHNAYAPESTVQVLSVPAIANDPLPPQKAVYGADPYKNATIKKVYEHACASYQQTLLQAHTSLNAVRLAVKAQTDKLRSLHLQTDTLGGTDIEGFLDRSFVRLQSIGEHTILIASDLQENEYRGYVNGLHLTNTKVWAIWYYSADPLAKTVDAWRSVFLRAGVRDKDIAFYAPDQSQILTQFF